MMRHAYIAVITLAALMAVGCARHVPSATGPKPTAFGSALVESSGGKQIAAAGTALPQTVVVQVNDDQGTAVTGALVEMSGPSGVTFDPANGLTDSSGQFTTNVSLGGMAGRYQITASTLNKSQKRVELKLDEIALGYQQVFGQQLNNQYCDRCHNPESTAERVSNYDNLEVKPHPFSEGETINKLNDADLLAIISHGGPALNKSPLMPPYGYTLSKSEIQALIAYIRAVSDPPYRTPGLVYAKISCLTLPVFFILTSAFAQVVSPVEMKDPQLRALQEQYMDDLKAAGADILSIPTTYPFYLSRRLDLDEPRQKAADQRSIRFDHYKGKTVLEITGNYYAAYSTEKMTPEQRARETFRNVVLPILKVTVPRFQSNTNVQAYALEISHHVLGKVMGVAMERPENLVVVLPQESAIRLLDAKDDTAQQAALLKAEIYLNAQPVTLWLNREGPQLATAEPASDPPSATDPAPASSTPTASVEIASNNADKLPGAIPMPTLKGKKAADPPAPVRNSSPQALAGLQASRQERLTAMVKDLEPQAHFVSYAPPSFVAFRSGVYLELSINTALSETPAVSRYRLAALAFDDHISHLIRPVLGYFKDDSEFDGIGFSTNLHVAGKTSANASSQAVEFFFPFSALRCYERYDCTGQQLIDAGTVLINGERVSLDLQIAEGGANR